MTEQRWNIDECVVMSAEHENAVANRLCPEDGSSLIDTASGRVVGIAGTYDVRTASCMQCGRSYVTSWRPSNE